MDVCIGNGRLGGILRLLANLPLVGLGSSTMQGSIEAGFQSVDRVHVFRPWPAGRGNSETNSGTPSSVPHFARNPRIAQSQLSQFSRIVLGITSRMTNGHSRSAEDWERKAWKYAGSPHAMAKAADVERRRALGYARAGASRALDVRERRRAHRLCVRTAFGLSRFF
jgi:hypothetical protein